jgi:ABC-type multidrug transport system fused ATPase/permease subunit
MPQEKSRYRDVRALGQDTSKTDHGQLRRACSAAQILDFIENELSDGFQTAVGERGVRLSGGQRQRIGIARALYHQPQILVMDEATSALDNITEKQITRAIDELKGGRTIVMIAHRLTTVQNCDLIYLMKNGEIIDRGTYDELVSQNEEFRKMALIQ